MNPFNGGMAYVSEVRGSISRSHGHGGRPQRLLDLRVPLDRECPPRSHQGSDPFDAGMALDVPAPQVHVLRYTTHFEDIPHPSSRWVGDICFGRKV